MSEALAQRLQTTQFLRATGLLDAYEAVIESLVSNGWPSERSLYDHASDELLRWHAEHKDEYDVHRIMNPGSTAHVMPLQLMPSRERNSGESVEDAAAACLAAAGRYPEID